MKKFEGRQKSCSIFCCGGYKYSKNHEYENKINWLCVLYRKAPVLPILNSGSFSIFKSPITQKVLWRSKKQKSKREYRTTRKHQLSHQGIIRTKISTPKMLTSLLLQKYRQSSGKEEQPIYHLFPRSIHMLESNEL